MSGGSPSGVYLPRTAGRRSVLRGSALGVGGLGGSALAGSSALAATPTGSSALAAVAVALSGRYFLTVAGIAGESTQRAHRGAIEVVDSAWGVTRPQSSSSTAAGRPVFTDFHFTKLVDKSSPLLFLACVEARVIATATLDVVGAGQAASVVRSQIVLSGVEVTDFETEDTASGDLVDRVSLAFQKIQFSYIPIDAKGQALAPMVTGWDLAGNKRA